MIGSLSFAKLDFAFGSEQALLSGASVDLPVGESVLIEGASGSGKSVVLKLLGGLLSPTRGSYFINDQDVAQMSFEEFLPYRKLIGYSFDYGGLLANRTIRDNLMLPLLYHNEVSYVEAEVRVAELMERFNLTAVRDRRPAAVSGGVRKTANVARAFVLEPEMLLLDDPFVGLDSHGVKEFVSLLGEHRKEKRLKHVFFTSRGELVATALATKRLRLEGRGLKLELLPAKVTAEEQRKAAGE